MFRTLSQAVGFALCLVTVLSPEVHADAAMPAWCWPFCDYQLECEYWWGQGWNYCGYNSGWVYCCNY